MGYVAIKGGERAIEEAARVLEFLRTRGADQGEAPLSADAIEHQLHFLHGQVMSAGGLYDPELASLAIKQSLGDPLEAAFYVRAFRCTRPRLSATPRLALDRTRLIRRVSAAFKEVPGGQMLGPTPDYRHRLFDFDLLDETPADFQAKLRAWMEDIDSDAAAAVGTGSLPKVLDFLREQGLAPPLTSRASEPFDITRQPIVFPLPRSAQLSTMARAQTGSILALGYSVMRGYGDIHPTVGELRVGYVPVLVKHPAEPSLEIEVGEVLLTECEVVSMYEAADEDADGPTFGVGYGACFGHDEAKAISMAMLDRSLQHGATHGPRHPAEDAEFVLLHIDGVDSMGFCTHYKMPHYVTFQSDLDRLRTTRARQAEGTR